MDNTAKSSWMHDAKVGIRILQLHRTHCPRLLLLLLCTALADVAFPFVGIIFSARILDCLLEQRDPADLPHLILLAVGCSLMLNLLQLFFRHHRTLQDYQVELMHEHFKVAKFLELDYEHMENPDSQNLILHAEEGFSVKGRSQDQLRDIERLLTGCMSLVVALVVSAPLFVSTARSKPSMELGFPYSLLNPFILILLLFGVSLLGIYLSDKENQMIYSETQDMAKINRLFRYLKRTMGDIRYGKEIRLFNIGPMLNKNSEQQYQLLLGYFQSVLKRTIKPKLLIDAMRSLTVGVIYLYVALQALYGIIPISGILLYCGAFFQLNNSIASICDAISSLRGRSPYLRLYLDFLGLKALKPIGERFLPVSAASDHEIEFRNVSFRYPGSSDYSVRNISLRLKMGKRTAVVGVNGAGKTTFIKLLCRLLDPTEGAIIYNGVDIREIGLAEYQKLFAVVFQDFQLMPFTVGENVAVANDYDTERVHAALHKASIEERVAAMPFQLDQHVYKTYDAATGIEISGGEAQKLAIARVVYKDAPLFILDEPTAALDPKAESEIYARFAEIAGDRTTVFISHRLSSCRLCQEVVVFHQGCIVQTGSHEELLLDHGGKYAELWHAQAQYYVPDDAT